MWRLSQKSAIKTTVVLWLRFDYVVDYNLLKYEIKIFANTLFLIVVWELKRSKTFHQIPHIQPQFKRLRSQRHRLTKVLSQRENGHISNSRLSASTNETKWRSLETRWPILIPSWRVEIWNRPIQQTDSFKERAKGWWHLRFSHYTKSLIN